MKKLIILIAFALISLVGFSQRVFTSGSISATAGIGVSTTTNIQMFTGAGWSLEMRFKKFDADSTVIDLGQCAYTDSAVFNRLDDTRFPYNLLQDSSVVFQGDNFLSRYLQIKLTTYGVTAGKKCYYTITKE
jgi:hypothetical protein